MPVIELASFVLLAVYGSGEKRSAAIIRVIFHSLLTAVFGFLLFASLVGLSDTFLLAVSLALIMAIACFLTGRAAMADIERLWHWGEPQVIAGSDGLQLPRRNRTIPWADIVKIVPGKRGLKIEVADNRSVYLRTARANELAAAIQSQSDMALSEIH